MPERKAKCKHSWEIKISTQTGPRRVCIRCQVSKSLVSKSSPARANIKLKLVSGYEVRMPRAKEGNHIVARLMRNVKYEDYPVNYN